MMLIHLFAPQFSRSLAAIVARIAVIAVLSMATTAFAGTKQIIDNASQGFYNNAIGTTLNGTDPGFPSGGDPSIPNPPEPNLDAAAKILGNWLALPPELNANWSGLQAIPSSWPSGHETAVIYPFGDDGTEWSDLSIQIGVDNGAFVWLDGEYLGGQVLPGGVVPGELSLSVPNLGPGEHFLQIIREDHGGSTGFTISVTGVAGDVGPVDLCEWMEMDYAGDGGAGNWQVSGDCLTVLQTINGDPAYFVSDFDLVDSNFAGTFEVLDTGDDDFIGFVFGFEGLGEGLRYYLVTWKRNAQDTGEEGFKLLKIDGIPSDGFEVSTSGELWDGEDSTHVAVLAEQVGSTEGWASNTPYLFSLDYEIAGEIRVIISSADSGAVLWDTGVVVDADPIGVGRVGFFNYSQPNVRYSGFAATPLVPDLVPVQESIGGPIEGVAGQPATFTWTIANDGDVAAEGTWVDRISLSTDPEPGGGDIVIGTASFTGVLKPGESYQRSQTFDLPSSSGTYYIVVETDATGLIGELGGESNNASVGAAPVDVAPIPRPDLIVDSVIRPSSGVLSGSTVEIDYIVTNVGTTATPPAWKDLVIFSADTDLIDPPAFLFNETILAEAGNPQFLLPGESYANTVVVTIPNDITGTYYIAVYADGRPNGPDGAVFSMQELDEGNNVLFGEAFSVTLEPQPDLIAVDVDAPSKAFSGFPMTVSWTSENQGDGVTDSGQFAHAIFLSTNDSPTITPGDVLFDTIGPSSIQPLQPGQSADFQATEPLDVDLFGSFYIKVFVDSTDAISEFGFEGNNIGVSEETVEVILSAAPDLVPSSIAVDAPNPYPGQLVAVTWAADNDQGAPPPFPVSWVDDIYLSSNPTLEIGTDVRLGGFGQSSGQDAGGSPIINPYEKTRSVRLPDDLAAGTYYFIVNIDDNGDVFEGIGGGEDNNILATVSPIVIESVYSDLSAIIDAEPDSSGAAGSTVTIGWQTSNVGDAITPVTTWRDRVYFSANDSLGSGDILLATRTRSGSLLPGGAYGASASVVIPNQAAGSYFLLVVTDAIDEVFEGPGGNGNNLVAFPFDVTGDAPDLVVSAVDAVRMGTSGDVVEVEWSVRNDGTLPTGVDTWQDRAWLSVDKTLGNGDDIFLGARTRSGELEPEETYGVTAAFDIPISLSGTYFVFVRVDALEAVFEVDDNNNDGLDTSPLVIALADVANLVTSGVGVRGAAVSGQPIDVSWMVTNTGAGPTNVASWADSVYLSLDQFFDPGDDLHLGTIGNGGAPLAPGEGYRRSASPTIPLGVSGSYFVIARTDSGNAVFEDGEEADNIAPTAVLTQITVPQPSDLVAGIYMPPSGPITLGEPVMFTWATHNVGDEAVSGQWKDSLYLSPDPMWDLDDVKIGTFTSSTGGSGPLAPGETLVSSATADVPGVVPGSYFVLLRTDVFNNVPETDETNNCCGISMGQVTVGAIPLVLSEPSAPMPYVGTLQQGQERFFELVVPSDETVRITLDHSSPIAWTELYVKYGSVPSTGDFDFQFDNPGLPDQEIVIPNTQAGTYYILARATNGTFEPGGVGIGLLAERLPFGIQSTTPSMVGNSGPVTVIVEGTRFSSGLEIEAVGVGGVAIAGEVEVRSEIEARVRFDFDDVPLGAYDVVARQRADEAVLIGGLEIVATVPPIIAADIGAFPTPRAGESFIVPVVVENLGNIDGEYTTIVVGAEGLIRLEPEWPDGAFPVPDPTGLESQFVQFDGETYTGLTIRDFPPGQQVVVPVLVSDATGTPFNLTVRGAAASFDDFLPIVAGTIEELRLFSLENPSIDLPGEVQEIVGDPLLWQEFWLQYLFDVGYIDQLPTADEAEGLGLTCNNTPCGNCCQAWAEFVIGCGIGAYVTGNPLGCFGGGLGFAIMKYWICTWDPGAYCDIRKCVACRINPWCPCPIKCDLIQPAMAMDPNEKVSDPGFGADRWVAPSPVPYIIYFENIPEATAPAARVEIRDEISSLLNPASFRLGDISFGETIVEVPPNQVAFTTSVDLVDSIGLRIDILAGINAGADPPEAFWILQAIDPATGEPPVDGLVGFLPPEDGSGAGQGYVEFEIAPRLDVSTGVIIENWASIVFDVNEPIITNTVFNTVDADAPMSVLDPIPPVVPGPEVELTFAASDSAGGSGLSGVELFVSIDGGSLVPVTISDEGSATYEGAPGRVYGFSTQAIDNAGNVEPLSASPQVTTAIPDVSLAVESDSGVVGDGITNDNTPTILVVSAPMADVALEISGEAGTISANVPTGANGRGAFTVGDVDALADGDYVVSASALGVTVVTDLQIDTVGPTIEEWTSVATHTGAGEAALPIAEDGSSVDPRQGGISTVLLTYPDVEGDVTALLPEMVQLDGRDRDGAAIDLSGTIVTTTVRTGEPVQQLVFAPPLPDQGIYCITLVGVTDAAGNPLGANDARRELAGLVGDATRDRRTNNTDVGGVQSLLGTDPIDPMDEFQVVSDVDRDGDVDDADLQIVLDARGTDLRFVPAPCVGAVLAVVERPIRSPRSSGVEVAARARQLDSAAATLDSNVTGKFGGVDPEDATAPIAVGVEPGGSADRPVSRAPIAHPPVDTRRIAVHDPIGRFDRTGVARAAGLTDDAVEALPIGGWWFVRTEESGTGDGSARRLIDALTARGLYATPVVRGEQGTHVLVPPTILVAFDPSVDPAVQRIILQTADPGATVAERHVAGLPGVSLVHLSFRSGFDVLGAIHDLEAFDEVRFAEPDAIFGGLHATQTARQPGADTSFGSQRLAQGLVAVLDDGVRGSAEMAADWTTSADRGEHAGRADASWGLHGTAMVDAMRDAAGSSVRVASARVVVTDADSSTWIGRVSWTLRGLAWASEIGADITNTSLACGYVSQAVAEQFARTARLGMIHFAMAGDHGPAVDAAFPARLDDVEAVGAVDGRMRLLAGSAGSAAFVATVDERLPETPGARWSASGIDAWPPAETGGTDLASARVAGIAATMVSRRDRIGTGDLRSVVTLLREASVDLGDPGWDSIFGWGRPVADHRGIASLAPTDVDRDGRVTVADLVSVIRSIGAGGGFADVNGDGRVDGDDLIEVFEAAEGVSDPTHEEERE